jgi:phosphatidate cytidylyltransferase
MNPIFKRTVTALATAAVVASAFIWLPKEYLVPLMIAVVALVHLEFSRLVSPKYPIMVFPGVIAGLVYLYSVVYAPRAYISIPLLAFLLAVAALSKKIDRPIASLATTVFGIVYIPVCLSALVLIPWNIGVKWLLYTVSIVKISDMGGFAFGIAFGKHKMCPAISPNKSWEGMAGSIFGSCLISCLFMPMTHFSWTASILLGLMAAVVGTLGDLVESRIKREMEVKDSSVFMPAGMGGLLDMFDSLVFAPALLYPFIRYLAS